MEHFLATQSREETATMIASLERSFQEHGYGLWAVELLADGALVGFVGLWTVEEDMPFAPGVELGWRIAQRYWGAGLAYEAALASARFAFERLGLDELVATTAERNVRSRRLMERLQMRPSGSFVHPRVPAGHALAPHVLYRLDAAAWGARGHVPGAPGGG
jgi:RimJ/RimL family protein N-acetyltransferase